MKFILLSGSFHSKSRSLAILECSKKYFIDHIVEIPRLDALPFYSEDLAAHKPDVVKALLSAIEASDGILFCTPEYNHSVPAVLKNAIDWVSRPAFNSVLKGKPVSIVTQAISPVGGARAQAHLKLILDSTLSKIQSCHEMMVTDVDKVFDSRMVVTNGLVLTRLERHVHDFIAFAQANRSMSNT